MPIRRMMICCRRSNRLRRVRGTVLPRVDDGAGEQRRLFGRERRGRLAEIRARCRLSAEDPVAPLDHVEINLEDASAS